MEGQLRSILRLEGEPEALCSLAPISCMEVDLFLLKEEMGTS